MESIIIMFALTFIMFQLRQIKKDVLEVKLNQLPMIQKCCTHEKAEPIVIDNELHFICNVCGYVEEVG